MDELMLKAVLQGIRTTPDGGWRITLDVDDSQTAEVARLSKLRDKVLNTVLIPDESV